MAVPTGTVFTLDPSLFASHQIAAAHDEATPPLALVEDALEALEIAHESPAISASSGGSTCLTCGVSSFPSTEDQRHHFKTDWHRLNVKRKLAGLGPVSEDQFLALIENDEDRDVLGSLSGSETASESDDDDNDNQNADTTTSTAGPQFVFSSPEGSHYAVWRCLVAPDRVRGVDPPSPSDCLKSLHQLTVQGGRWAIILFRGGHFSAAIFDVRPPKPKVAGNTMKSSSAVPSKYSAAVVDAALTPVAHKSFHKYVVRAKAGGKQSTKDATGKFARSAGSRLRRHNEVALHRDIQETLMGWQKDLESCSSIMIAAPGSNGKTLFSLGDTPVLNKADQRVKKVPFTTRRPTLSEVKRVARVLLTVYDANKAVQQQQKQTKEQSGKKEESSGADRAENSSKKKIQEGDGAASELDGRTTTNGEQETSEQSIEDKAAKEKQLEEQLEEIREAQLREEAARAKKAEKRAKQKQKLKDQRQAEAAEKSEAAAIAAKAAAEDEISRAAKQAAALAQRAQAKATAASNLKSSTGGPPKLSSSAQASAPFLSSSSSSSAPVRLSSKPLASEDAATRRARMAGAAEARAKALQEATAQQRLR